MELQEKNGQVGFRYRTCSGTCSSKALKALEPYGVCEQRCLGLIQYWERCA